MSITLTPDGGAVIPLPDNLVWRDEFTWNAAVSSQAYSTTGSQIIQGGVRAAGRPITLGGLADGGWMARVDAAALIAEADVFGRRYMLALHDSRTFQVEFAPGEGTAIARPVFENYEPDANEPYWLELRFITV